MGDVQCRGVKMPRPTGTEEVQAIMQRGVGIEVMGVVGQSLKYFATDHPLLGFGG